MKCPDVYQVNDAVEQIGHFELPSIPCGLDQNHPGVHLAMDGHGLTLWWGSARYGEHSWGMALR